MSLSKVPLWPSHPDHKTKITEVCAEGSRGALTNTNTETLALERTKLERSGLRIHLPLSGEQEIAAEDEDRRLLIGGWVCFGKFIVDVESLSHAAEKRSKDIGTHTAVD